MIIPAPLSLVCDFHGSVEFTVEVTNKKTKLPVPLNDAQEIWFTAKTSMSDADVAAVVAVTKTGGGITVDPVSTNIARIRANNVGVTNTDVTLFADVKVLLASSYKQVVAKGKLTIHQVVTQA